MLEVLVLDSLAHLPVHDDLGARQAQVAAHGGVEGGPALVRLVVDVGVLWLRVRGVRRGGRGSQSEELVAGIRQDGCGDG